jgi:hypothetical protein
VGWVAIAVFSLRWFTRIRPPTSENKPISLAGSRTWGTENPQLSRVPDHDSVVLRAHRDYAEAAGVEARAMKIRVTRTLRTSD